MNLTLLEKFENDFAETFAEEIVFELLKDIPFEFWDKLSIHNKNNIIESWVFKIQSLHDINNVPNFTLKQKINFLEINSIHIACQTALKELFPEVPKDCISVNKKNGNIIFFKLLNIKKINPEIGQILGNKLLSLLSNYNEFILVGGIIKLKT